MTYKMRTIKYSSTRSDYWKHLENPFFISACLFLPVLCENHWLVQEFPKETGQTQRRTVGTGASFSPGNCSAPDYVGIVKLSFLFFWRLILGQAICKIPTQQEISDRALAVSEGLAGAFPESDPPRSTPPRLDKSELASWPEAMPYQYLGIVLPPVIEEKKLTLQREGLQVLYFQVMKGENMYSTCGRSFAMSPPTNTASK